MDQPQISGNIKTLLVSILFGIFAFIIVGLFSFFLFGSSSPVGLGWYVFSFAAGLTMIVLPCTLPLAFVIVPLSMGKGPLKGLAIALAFGLGITMTLSMYGVVTAIVGKAAITGLGASLETIKNYMYLVAGFFAYVFALGELGLVRFRMPTYSGAYPMFIQRQQDVIKAFLLGLFLGNIGIGCPHPATPVILTRIAVSGSALYGWLLFLVHAIGRVLPLIFLAILGILGVNALQSLVKHKERIERATGWGMVFVAAFILVLGLFSHDWWVNSGQHVLFEEIVQEQRFTNLIADNLNVANVHTHGMIQNPRTLFGLPWQLGNWALVFLWVLPFWWYYAKQKKSVASMPEEEKKILTAKLPTLFWNYCLITASLGVLIIYVLPLRFAVQSSSMGHGEEMVQGDGHMMEASGATQYHEQGAVQSGVSVDLNVIPTNAIFRTDILSGDETEKRCGPQPPAACGYGTVLGCRIADQQWGCYSIPIITASSTRLDFFVNEKPGNMPVPLQELEIEHMKYMHVIGVRDDLNEFFHIHPLSSCDTVNPTAEQIERSVSKSITLIDKGNIEMSLGCTTSLDMGTFSIRHTFVNPGQYKIWSEIKKDGVNYTFGHPPFVVQGAGVTENKKVSFARQFLVGNYQALLSLDEPVVKGHPHDLTFEIHTPDGRDVELDDYLAAKMHLTVIKDDWKQIIHTHPEGPGHAATFRVINRANANGGEKHSGAQTNVHGISFQVIFPEAGLYKAFAQFHPKNSTLLPEDALTAEFWIEVKDKAPSGISTWTGLLMVSLIAIGVLTWLVRRYLKVGS